ncbi:MAG: FAD-dependent oxidoreductase, partial [Dokdonella sp.]
MAQSSEVKVPDIGGFDDIPVIEVLVQVGETVKKDQGLITLESDKATMEVPSSMAGVIKELKVKVGDSVSEGSVIAIIDAADAPAESVPAAPAKSATTAAAPAKPSAAVASIPASGEASKPAASGNAPKAASDSGRKADYTCQVAVIGAGPGGYSAAFRAADLDQEVVLIERYPILGGVCLNVGCIPSKALLHAARVVDEAASMASHGISFGEPKIDLDKLRDFKKGVVGQLTKGLAGMAKQRKVTVVTGVAKFISANEIEVETPDGNKLVRFDNAIIAAGSQAFKLPGFPWDDPRVMDSTDALDLVDIP